LTALATLAAFPARLAETARAAADRPVRDGEWSVEQVVRHLVAVETEVHQRRLDDLASETEPTWTWTEPGPWTGEPELDLDRVLKRFAALREETLAILAALDDAGVAISARQGGGPTDRHRAGGDPRWRPTRTRPAPVVHS
jgi:hypothetical protein